MIKACIFDLDGTLVRSDPGITKGVQKSLEYFGIYEKIPEGFIGRHEAEGFLCAHAAFGGGYAPAG